MVVFRTDREGLARVLGDLEAEVMEYMWRPNRGPTPASEVAAAVSERRGVKPITVVTVLNNLVEKGLLTREKEGRHYLYEAASDRDTFLESISRDLLEGVLAMSAEQAIISFVDVASEIDPETLRTVLEKFMEQEEDA